MINGEDTLVYPNWLPSLLKFLCQRIHDISETPPSNLAPPNKQLDVESSLREQAAEALRKIVASAYIAVK